MRVSDKTCTLKWAFATYIFSAGFTVSQILEFRAISPAFSILFRHQDFELCLKVYLFFASLHVLYREERKRSGLGEWETDDCHVHADQSCENPFYPLWQCATTASTDLTRVLIRNRWIFQPYIRPSVWQDEIRCMRIEIGSLTSLLHTQTHFVHMTWVHECTVCIGLHTRIQRTNTSSVTNTLTHTFTLKPSLISWWLQTCPRVDISSSKTDCSLYPPWFIVKNENCEELCIFLSCV